MVNRILRVEVSDLPVGRRIANPIYQHTGQNILLTAGSKITPSFLESLKKRNIAIVRVHSSDKEAWIAASGKPIPRWFDFSPYEMHPVPKPVSTLAEDLEKTPPSDDILRQRSHQRFTLTRTVSVIPVDEFYLPTGDAFQAVSRNISVNGFCFVTTSAVSDKWFLIELAAPGGGLFQIVMEARRCQRVGRFYEVGGPLIYRLDKKDLDK